MAIPLTGSAGLFTRIGKLGAVIANMRAYQATQLQAMTNTTTGVVAQFNAESDIQALQGSAYIGQLNSAGSLGSFYQQMAIQTINRMVFRDFPLINLTLQQVNLQGSLEEVIKQMRLSGDTVLAMTVAATPAAFIGTGNGVINASVRRPSDGLVLENSFAETVLFTCTGDSYSGSASAGNESFTVTGVGQQSDFFAFNWPLGSNATLGISAIDGNSDNSAGNLLTNSNYEDWTSNVPDNNTLAVGTAGTNINRESSIVYSGDFAMRITGAGGTLTSLLQQFDDGDTGTSGILTPQSQYSYNVFVRRDGTIPAAGIWEVALVDENGTIVQDNNGVDNSFTIDLTLLSTVYTSFTAVFRTPSIMPESISLRRRLTTALTNGRSVYFDLESFGSMQQLYLGGPYFAIHAGSIPFEDGDYGTCPITNSRGAAGTLNTFQTVFQVLFNMMSFDLILPSSSTPTISDNLLSP